MDWDEGIAPNTIALDNWDWEFKKNNFQSQLLNKISLKKELKSDNGKKKKKKKCVKEMRGVIPWIQIQHKYAWTDESEY